MFSLQRAEHVFPSLRFTEHILFVAYLGPVNLTSMPCEQKSLPPAVTQIKGEQGPGYSIAKIDRAERRSTSGKTALMNY